MLRPLLLALLGVAASLPAHAASDAWSCRDALSFRWAGLGEAPEPGVQIPGDLDPPTPPFLVDPQILSVTPVRDPGAPYIEIGFGPDAAATLAEETRAHAGDIMVITLGRVVLASPRVMDALGDGRVVALYMPSDDPFMERVVGTLRQKAAGCPAPAGGS